MPGGNRWRSMNRWKVMGTTGSWKSGGALPQHRTEQPMSGHTANTERETHHPIAQDPTKDGLDIPKEASALAFTRRPRWNTQRTAT